MDWEKGMEKLRDMIVGEMRQEFKEFKSAVTGELSGYRIALESLSARMTNMENELRATRTDLTSRIENVRTEISDKIDAVRSELSDKIDSVRSELKAEIDATRAELKTEIIDVRTELSDKIETVRSELSGKIDTVRSELKAEIDTTRTELKAEIRENTRRIDTCNNRIDALQFEFIQVRERLDKAISQKVLVEDLAVRVTSLEAKAA